VNICPCDTFMLDGDTLTTGADRTPGLSESNTRDAKTINSVPLSFISYDIFVS